MGLGPTLNKDKIKNKLNMVTIDNFTKIRNSVNGSPRYVIHFLRLLTKEEQDDIRAKARPMQPVNDMYMEAVNKAKGLGGKRYRGKDYGGGIVFQTPNLQDLANRINKLLE